MFKMASIGNSIDKLIRTKTQCQEGPWFELDFCELRIILSEVDPPVSISVWVNNEKRYIVDQCHKMKITQKRPLPIASCSSGAHFFLFPKKALYENVMNAKSTKNIFRKSNLNCDLTSCTFHKTFKLF